MTSPAPKGVIVAGRRLATPEAFAARARTKAMVARAKVDHLPAGPQKTALSRRLRELEAALARRG